MPSDHTLTVHFEDGDAEYVTFECHLSGPERPCALISCPVDHEDVSHACVEAHGAVAQDECWAVQWYTAAGRATLNTEGLASLTVPVDIYFDEGVVVENAGSDTMTAAQDLRDAVSDEFMNLTEHGWARPIIEAFHALNKHTDEFGLLPGIDGAGAVLGDEE